jgi:hypothetical protein
MPVPIRYGAVAGLVVMGRYEVTGFAITPGDVGPRIIAADVGTGIDGGGGKTSGDVFVDAVAGLTGEVVLQASTRPFVTGHGCMRAVAGLVSSTIGARKTIG